MISSYWGKYLHDGLLYPELGVPRQRDDPEEGSRPRAGLVLEERLVLGLDHLLEEALRLLGIQDREGSRETDRLAVHAERPVPDRVEGAAPEAARLDARQLVDPVEHLLGRLVGEGEEQDLAGRTPWESSQATR